MPRGFKITPNFDTLSKTINLLGSELGNVIKDQAGAKYFKIVEDIRLNSKKYRQTNNNKYLDSIFKTLQSLEPNEIYIITKAFTIFFYLSNIAEQVFREHTLKNSNISIDKKTNSELIFMPVFTAHPTESSRQSTLKKIYKIAEIIENNDSNSMSEINSLITQLWYTREVRSTKPNPIDEVKSLIYYLDILYKDVYKKVIKDDEITGNAKNFKLKFGSWVGADKDGNPFVTKNITKEALKIYSNQILNIYKELQDDLKKEVNYNNGNLDKWAKQGVFLLNTTLTVEKSKPLSHQKFGWDIFTDKVISVISNELENIVFILWGSFAQSKKEIIDSNKHLILSAPHPSPLSAHRGFFGSKPFSKTNTFLKSKQIDMVEW